MVWLIWNKASSKPYLQLAWKTREEARKELVELLRPYPKGHEWRRCLELRERRWIPVGFQLVGFGK